MMNLKKYFILLLTFGMFMSCSDELSDLNVDPNKSPSANPEEVLSSAQGYLGYVIDGQYNVRSALWAQYWTWGPGVAIGNIERYVSDGTDYDNGWARMYSGALTDFTFVENSNAKVHAGIAKILKAYSFQLLVDHFGSIPFSEALSGATTGNFAPKYDDGQTVYNALTPMINDGLTLLASDGEVGAEDFVYGGSVDQWTKFANSLKLKILMRQSNAKDVSA
ncbi:MAG TPA: SusD/RagB family nutrient-binding outer membrane lipoprotein, partial [Saprospiraceae bacterium]|nr:SusD/RagB family nutrient-binding outer membrane lipoprotein [Saprospiraceae bacterium]